MGGREVVVVVVGGAPTEENKNSGVVSEACNTENQQAGGSRQVQSHRGLPKELQTNKQTKQSTPPPPKQPELHSETTSQNKQLTSM